MFDYESFDSKWIKFYCTHDTGKTKTWVIIPNDGGEKLGHIKWYAQWRKYCFFPQPNCVFETDCLDDITRFIRAEMAQRLKNKQHIKFLANVDKAKEWLNANGKLSKAGPFTVYYHGPENKKYTYQGTSDEACISILLWVKKDYPKIKTYPF